MKVHSGERNHEPIANRTHLLVACITCNKKTFQKAFMDHCPNCQKAFRHAKIYDMHLLTKRWIAKSELK